MKQTFFLITQLGLEDLAERELKRWCPDVQCIKEPGGLSVQLELLEGLQLNSVLKLPTRILLRLTSFKASDFPKLFNRLVEFKWPVWMPLEAPFKIHVATHRSRLKIKTRIEKTALDSLDKVRIHRKVKLDASLPEQNVYIRLLDDQCVVSFDTSGERLHKRQLAPSQKNKEVGAAPLRETLASAVLQTLIELAATESKVPVELVDPMMGSGTFLQEASAIHQVLPVRSTIPLRDEQRLEIENSLKGLVDKAGQRESVQFASLVGFEKDKKTYLSAERNLEQTAKSHSIRLIAQDFNEAEPLSKTPNVNRWVVCNPPYGHRLKLSSEAKLYYEKLFRSVDRVAQPRWAAFLIPAAALKGLWTLPAGWDVALKKPLSNGGIAVTLWVFKRLP